MQLVRPMQLPFHISHNLLCAAVQLSLDVGNHVPRNGYGSKILTTIACKKEPGHLMGLQSNSTLHPIMGSMPTNQPHRQAAESWCASAAHNFASYLQISA